MALLIEFGLVASDMVYRWTFLSTVENNSEKYARKEDKNMSETLICYGDSNTYGYDPHDTNEGRYPKEVRWTGILDTETDWKVENHGVNGRSIPHTVSTVKFACQQVRDWHRKPNSVWLWQCLGTNDLLENPDFYSSGCGKEDGTLSETNDGRSRTCKQKGCAFV